MNKFRLLILIIFSAVVFQHGFAQFGKNKLQYTNFEWRFIQSKHFDVYYYPGAEKLAEFTAEVAEDAYLQLKRDYSYEIKQRIVLIIYKSHNDWQQTNVVLSYLEEGIGGVTELYKNRIVVPFEGSYEQFRHVIHHELVHGVMNDLLYGGSIQSLLVGEVVPVPLWVAEGLAEFGSTGWGTRTDMIVRDAVLSDYIPPVQYLEYILVYQGGNSMFRYIAETYGREKIGEILLKARGNVGFQQVLVSAIGLDYEGLTEKWHRWLKKNYSPEVNNRLIPKEFSEQMTNHKKLKNFLNVSPAITPQGDKIAYIADRSGYQNIYLMSALDGKELKTLVKGQSSESFEELHFLRPGISFSPNGRKLAFTAKSGQWDAIYIRDINTGQTDKHVIKMNGAFTTSWSPDGRRIAFVGNNNEKSDIFIYELATRQITPVTNDVFTDDQPSWSPDGRYLAFVSDRGNYISDRNLPADFRMSEYDYEFRDVYTIDLETGKMQRLTNTPWEEAYPLFSPDGKKLAFTSDESGIFNVYIKELDTGEYYAVTNIMSGVLQIQWDRQANKLVYTTFYDGGFDIYLINNPLELDRHELKLTQFANDMRNGGLPIYARKWQRTGEDEKEEQKQPEEMKGEQPADYSNYVFGAYRPRQDKKKPKDIEIPDFKLKDEFGNYKSRKYKIKFSPDLVTGAAGYNTFFGFQGYTTFAFSDLLGDHQILLNASLWTDLRNSNFALIYYYLKRRINYGVGGFHLVYLLSNGYTILRYRNYGVNFMASYPLSRFDRLDFMFIWYNVNLEHLDFGIPVEKISAWLPEMQYVHDNVLWGFRWGIPSPVSGSRYNISIRFSPKFSDVNLDFRTLKFDYRRYMMLNPQYQLAFRATAGASFGQDSQNFFLGGMDNWINPKYGVGGRRVNRIQDVFFSEFITPLRGAFYYERTGNRFFLVNTEFRFPLVRYLQLGFPPVSLFNVSGVAFYDIGAAWYQEGAQWWSLDNFRGISDGKFQDLVSGYGLGARIYFLGFLVRFDVAWPYDFDRTYDPIYYWSLGLNF